MWAKPVSMPSAFEWLRRFSLTLFLDFYGCAVSRYAVSEFLGFGGLKLVFSPLDRKTVRHSAFKPVSLLGVKIVWDLPDLFIVSILYNCLLVL